MKRFPSNLLLILIFATSTFATLNRRAGGDERIDFDSQIRPILSDRCFACHGPDEADREADLRFDDRESATRESEYGERPFVIKPNSPDESELMLRLTTDDEGIKMPPPESHLKLSEDEILLIRKWIEQGAEWSEHWAFEAVAKVPPPELENDSWSSNVIDRFVLQRLRQVGLRPSSPASKEILARRVYFDLTGLPPSLEELSSFLADEKPDAYERLVDQLLSTSAYGERMAVDWLDVARYADTHGYQLDFESNVWPYRDWVISAFNRNMPFDEFITWQLAGDLLPNSTTEQKLATAFNRMHRQTNEGGSVTEEFRQEYVADRVDTFGVAFLGLSVGCARCHDHKFDPISQKEYYQLAAFFDNIDEIGVFSYFTKSTPTPSLELPTKDQSSELAKLESDLIQAQAEYDRRLANQRQRFESWLTKGRRSFKLGDEYLYRESLAHFDFEEMVEREEDGGEDNSEAEKSGKESNERTGRFVKNLLDSNSHGEVHESPRIVESINGKGLLLNGDDGFTSKVTQEFGRHKPFTFSLWIRNNENPTRATVFHTTQAGTDAGNRGIELRIIDGNLEARLCHFWPGNAISIRSTKPLPVGEWFHVAYSYDGSSKASGVSLYVNGERVDCQTIRDGLTRTIRHVPKDEVGYKAGNIPHHLTVGYRYRDRGLANGTIDDLMVFGRQLSPIEICLLAGQDPAQSINKAVADMSHSEMDQLFRLYLQTLASADEAYSTAKTRLEDARIALAAKAEDVASIMVMSELAEPRQTYVLNRGRYDSPGDAVDPGVITNVLPFDEKLPRNRLGLAQWLIHPEHPLTARVAVNRLWQSVFGRGLVGTQEDFGSQGGRPSHVELLDFLAKDFIDSKWDVKRLMKSMVLSSTYRQSSRCSSELYERDPENELLARGPSQRLPAEMIRDGALKSSGLLVDKIGGPPVKPYQPPGIWKESMSMDYERDEIAGSRRRSIYSYWKRTLPPPSMVTFDAAKREVCTVRRESTATPLQALVLLNDPQYIEAARAAAWQAMQAESDDRSRVEFLYETFTSRRPTERQVKVLLAAWNQQFEYFDSEQEKVDEYLAVGDFIADSEIDAAELAAWSVVAQMMMNLDYFVMKR